LRIKVYIKDDLIYIGKDTDREEEIFAIAGINNLYDKDFDIEM
jgi:hypothetical protein